MKPDFHPPQHEIIATCVCDNKFSFYSSLNVKTMNIEVCNKCHPFYTGKRQTISTAGRIDRFNSKFSNFREQNMKVLEKAALAKNPEKSKKLRKEPKKPNETPQK